MYCPTDGAPLVLTDDIKETEGAMTNSKGSCEHGCAWFVLVDPAGEYRSLATPYIPLPTKVPGTLAAEDSPEVVAAKKEIHDRKAAYSEGRANQEFGKEMDP